MQGREAAAQRGEAERRRAPAWEGREAAAQRGEAERSREKPRLAVFKFASCDGCQLSILNLEDEILELAERFHVAAFLEASSRFEPGPYDVALVEGSVTTAKDAERIRRVRADARVLVTIGACATAGGIQALRNLADVAEWKAHVYPQPGWITTLPTSTPISGHVKVDHEIHGCPVNKTQVLRVLTRLLLGATPDLPGASVCMECKRRGTVCVVVAKGIPCMGPVTRAGCGAICPALGRDCYACFGPMDDPNPDALAQRFLDLGLARGDVVRRFRGITGQAPPFRGVAERLEAGDG
jgi:coenzyme F420-reducing hydrogenase gamma subunit